MLSALVAGAAMYYLQVYAFYRPVEVSSPAAAIRLVSLGGVQEAMLTSDFEAIDADSSPLRFRGCFVTPMTLAMLSETFESYEDPTPLNAPPLFVFWSLSKYVYAKISIGAGRRPSITGRLHPVIQPGRDAGKPE